MKNFGVIGDLTISVLGEGNARKTLTMLNISGTLLAETGPHVSRAAFAMALNVLLFEDLIRRAPSGATYVSGVIAEGGRVMFDHGALRTIRFEHGNTGALPAGQDAFTRLFEPLGYELADVYPLPKLRMTGRAFRHIDAPEALPQFFLSELHIDQFSEGFAIIAERVFGQSADPLNAQSQAVLQHYSAQGSVPFGDAAEALPVIAAAFGCHHPPFSIADYEGLLAESAEAAWIATEGNSFNHATDRVPDVVALHDSLGKSGFPIKQTVEISASGRVRQTALKADMVEREFVGADGTAVKRAVPGSFFEFISRDFGPDGTLDLHFDSANATGIFAMTSAV